MKRRKAARRRGRLRNKLAALAAVLVAAAVLLAFSPPGQQLRGLVALDPAGPLRAAIVDQAAAYDVNPEFVAAATDTLEAAGYAVDYYPGEEVTVDLYRELPAHGYDLIIFRVHSARMKEDEKGKPVDEVVLFTSEAYAAGSYEEQADKRLAWVRYYEGGPLYFGIRPSFVISSMRGNLAGTTIMLMGCDGLTSVNATARAFLVRGADSFISWDASISWGHSDAAIQRLLELMLVDGLDTEEAVEQTADELGPDPVFGAQLRVLTDHR